MNLTFWENVTNKAFASKCWHKLSKAILRKYPDVRIVGVWARQGRGAWHIHAVVNQRIEVNWLRSTAFRCGFGPQMLLREIDDDPRSPVKLARYIAGYCTDKNGLDPERDKGVRRTIFVGSHVRFVDMRYKSSLKRVVSLGRAVEQEINRDEWGSMSDFERHWSGRQGRKRSYETWGEWYTRNRDYWFSLGWDSLSAEEREELLELDEFTTRYLATGRWAYL